MTDAATDPPADTAAQPSALRPWQKGGPTPNPKGQRQGHPQQVLAAASGRFRRRLARARRRRDRAAAQGERRGLRQDRDLARAPRTPAASFQAARGALRRRAAGRGTRRSSDQATMLIEHIQPARRRRAASSKLSARCWAKTTKTHDIRGEDSRAAPQDPQRPRRVVPLRRAGAGKAPTAAFLNTWPMSLPAELTGSLCACRQVLGSRFTPSCLQPGGWPTTRRARSSWRRTPSSWPTDRASWCATWSRSTERRLGRA